jgi:hypothetical protein
VVRGHELRVVPSLSRGSAESLTYNRDEPAVHFSKQLETPEEMAAAQCAMDVCPTLAIGNDG